MKVTVNYVKKFKQTHRTIVSVTVHPGWFARIFGWATPTEICFIGFGTEWVRFFEEQDRNHS